MSIKLLWYKLSASRIDSQCLVVLLVYSTKSYKHPHPQQQQQQQNNNIILMYLILFALKMFSHQYDVMCLALRQALFLKNYVREGIKSVLWTIYDHYLHSL